MRERSDVFPGLGALSHFTPSPTSTKSLTEFLINAHIHASCYELFFGCEACSAKHFKLSNSPSNSCICETARISFQSSVRKCKGNSSIRPDEYEMVKMS